MVLGREAANGNYTRLAGSFTRFLSLAGALDLLLNPISLTVAAIGGAMLYAANQNEKLNEALALTGNYAGVTTDQLRNMATAATAGGATFSTAVTAVTELAATGRLSGDEIANLGKTAADAATYTSLSVQKMVDDFTKLADDPVKASVKLNDQYHYLTASTYDQIAALEKQGDATGAAKVAVEAFSAAMDERTKDIAANQGIILTGWRDIKSMINGAIEAVGSFGAAATPGQVVSRLQDNKTARLPIGQWSPDDEAELQKAIATRDTAIKAAQDKARVARQNQEVIDAKHAYDTFNAQFATPAEKRAKEISKYLDTIAGPLNLSPEQQLADQANIDAKYKDPKTPKAKAYQDDSGTRMLQQLHEQQAVMEAQLATTGKLTTAESELVKFNQQIMDWKGKTLTAAQKSLVNDQDAIRAQLQKNVELEKEVQHHQDVTKLQERSAQLEASIASYQKGQTEQHSRQLDAFGQGSDAQQQVQAVKSIYAEYQRMQDQLNKATPKDLIGGADYQAATADIKAGLDQSLKDYDDYYTSLKAKQADWSNGATAAIENYNAAAQNMAAQAESVVNNAFKGMEDTLVKFVTTGKLSFTSLADSIMNDITRMVVKSLESQVVSNLFGTGGNGAGSNGSGSGSNIFGNIFSMIGGSLGNGFSTFAANSMPGDSMDNLMSLTGGFGTIPGLATGGGVDAGSMYMVGEKGPELFVPSASGSIVPNHAIRTASPSDSSQSTGDRTSNFFMDISVPPGTTRQTSQQQASSIMRQAQISMARNN
jgi:lambda family phage tail tape measure protein